MSDLIFYLTSDRDHTVENVTLARKHIQRLFSLDVVKRTHVRMGLGENPPFRIVTTVKKTTNKIMKMTSDGIVTESTVNDYSDVEDLDESKDNIVEINSTFHKKVTYFTPDYEFSKSSYDDRPYVKSLTMEADFHLFPCDGYDIIYIHNPLFILTPVMVYAQMTVNKESRIICPRLYTYFKRSDVQQRYQPLAYELGKFEKSPKNNINDPIYRNLVNEINKISKLYIKNIFFDVMCNQNGLRVILNKIFNGELFDDLKYKILGYLCEYDYMFNELVKFNEIFTS